MLLDIQTHSKPEHSQYSHFPARWWWGLDFQWRCTPVKSGCHTPPSSPWEPAGFALELSTHTHGRLHITFGYITYNTFISWKLTTTTTLPNPNFNLNLTLNQVFTLKLSDLHYGDVFVPYKESGSPQCDCLTDLCLHNVKNTHPHTQTHTHTHTHTHTDTYSHTV